MYVIRRSIRFDLNRYPRLAFALRSPAAAESGRTCPMNQPLLTSTGSTSRSAPPLLPSQSAVLALLIAIAVLCRAGIAAAAGGCRPAGAARRGDGAPDRRPRPHPGRDRRPAPGAGRGPRRDGRPSLPAWWRSGSTRSRPGSATPWTRRRGRPMARLQSLNERIAVLDHAQKNLSELSGQVDLAARRARQQAGARRLRPGAHGDHHPGRAAEVALCLPAHAAQQHPAGLRDLPARPAPARHRRQVPARSDHRAARMQDRTTIAPAPPSACARTSGSTFPTLPTSTCCPARPRTWR